MMIPNSGLLRLTSILLVVIALSTGGSAQKTKTDIRLPGSIKPKHYDISIIPDLEANDMEGTASMEFSVDNSTDEIVMHGMNLTVDEESVILITLPSTKTTKAKDGHQVKAVSVSYDTSKDFIIIKLDSKLDPSFDYRVSLSYSGALSSNLKGLYRSSYFDQATQSNKWLAVTQFEPVAARLAFPCMDEPAMKATFTMSLGRRSDYTSLSNMPLIRSEPIAGKPGWFLDIFDRSVPMSTYLVAILISPFSFRQAKTVIRPSITDSNVSDSTEVRIWARPDAINETDLAVEVTPTMLEFLENYFQVHFPLPKVDLVGLPDFSSGAMENWGLITYRETTLLIDPVAPAVWDEMNVERVIAHELAHQWFGNLVTMEWWNDLWLNEGFATYVQRLVLDGVSPKYEYGTQQALNFLSVMEADALTTSHPISVNVENPTQISEIFDAISYTKGSAVIRMMNHFLGEKTFRQGVTNYLNEKKYLNARQDELWQFLTEQARADRVLPTDVDVKTIMDTWTLQMGFPLITIIRNYTQGTAHIQQERFLRGQSDEEKIKFVSREKSSSTPNYQWWVPISFTNAGAPNFSEKNTKPLLWLSPKKLSSTVRFRTNANNWVLANVLATGFYRVNYDDNNWRLLDEQLKTDHNVIHPINRAYLIDDIFALAATKTVSYATAFSLIEYLSKEEHYVPWSSALRSLAYIGRMFSHTAHHNRYKAFVLSIITPAYIRLGTEFSPDDSPLTKLSRISIISQACNQEYRPCIKRAQDLFDEWMNSSNPLQFKGILPDLRSSIYCTAIKYGTIKEWEFAWEMSQKVISAQVRDELLGALGCSREPSTLIRYLSFVLDPTSGVRKQDGRRVVNAVSGNSAGRLIAINYIMKNFDKLFHFFGNPVRVLQMLRSATANLNTPDDLTMIKEFLASKATLLEEAQSSANNIQAAIGANIQWMEDNYDTVNAWFASKEF